MPLPVLPARKTLLRHVTETLRFCLERLRASPLTLTLMAACVVIDGLCRHWGPDGWRALALWHMGELRWNAVLQGESYRVLAATVLHRDSEHLLSNLRALFIAGVLLEPALGARRTLVLYSACGFAGALCYLPAGGDVQVVGASGAIIGLEFALVGYWLRCSGPLPLSLGPPAYWLLQAALVLRGNWLPFAALARSRGVFAAGLLSALSREALPPRNPGHLGGALVGLLLSYTLWIRPKLLPGEAHPMPPSKAVSVLSGVAAVALVGSMGAAIIAGKPWRVTEEPRLATVRLQRTPFEVDVPELARHDATAQGDKTLPFFPFSSLQGAPVRLSISISAQPLDISAQTYVDMKRALLAKTELDDRQDRRSIQRTHVGVRPALRVDTQILDGFETAIEQSIDGYLVSVTGYRTRWAHEARPPIWDGIENRVAASLRIVQE